jgi:hypothetical protein
LRGSTIGPLANRRNLGPLALRQPTGSPCSKSAFMKSVPTSYVSASSILNNLVNPVQMVCDLI